MSEVLEHSSYRFSNRDEYCLRAGIPCKHQILLIPPLYDEMNRMRHMIVELMRLLADRNIGSIFPDLPGTNESLFPQRAANLEIWRDALKACLASYPQCSFVASFRGGCLIDTISVDIPIWRLTPVKGKSILRNMMRTRIASDKEAGTVTTMADLTSQASKEPIELAGNLIGPAMFEQLQESDGTSQNSIRTVRLESDSQSADCRLPGKPLWLRAEPDHDPILCEAIADDLKDWITS